MILSGVPTEFQELLENAEVFGAMGFDILSFLPPVLDLSKGPQKPPRLLPRPHLNSPYPSDRIVRKTSIEGQQEMIAILSLSRSLFLFKL